MENLLLWVVKILDCLHSQGFVNYYPNHQEKFVVKKLFHSKTPDGTPCVLSPSI